LFRLGTGARVRTYPVATTKTSRCRQISFTQDCSQIVTGSDHGIVYVFDRRSGVVVDELKMDCDTWVQTITVRRYRRNLKSKIFIRSVTGHGYRYSANDYCRQGW
jgi:hypothetical protein